MKCITYVSGREAIRHLVHALAGNAERAASHRRYRGQQHDLRPSLSDILFVAKVDDVAQDVPESAVVKADRTGE